METGDRQTLYWQRAIIWQSDCVFTVLIDNLTFISISGLFDIEALNMCHMLRSAVALVWSRSTYPFVTYATSRCDLDLWPLDLNVSVCRLSRDLTLYHILSKSNNPWPSYGDLNSESLGPSANLDSAGSGFSRLCSLRRPIAHPQTKFQWNSTIRVCITDDWTNFPRPIFGTILSGLNLKSWVNQCTPNLRTHRPIIGSLHRVQEKSKPKCFVICSIKLGRSS